jgi:hypothetical protein
MFKGYAFTIQFVEQIAVFPIIFYSLKISRSEFVLNRVMNNPIVSKIVVFISAITLEIYMSHTILKYPFLRLGIPFPVNIFFFIIISAATAYIIKYISETIAKRL